MADSSIRIKWGKACARLITATQKDEMAWNRVTNVSRLEEYDHIESIYEGTSKGETFRVFKYLAPGFNEETEENYMTPKFRLQILGSGDRIKYDVPDIFAVEDLYEVVRYKAENIDEILAKLST